jgi:hypothetical protein
MAEKGIGDYFISDANGQTHRDDEVAVPPLVLPVVSRQPEPPAEQTGAQIVQSPAFIVPDRAAPAATPPAVAAAETDAAQGPAAAPISAPAAFGSEAAPVPVPDAAAVPSPATEPAVAPGAAPVTVPPAAPTPRAQAAPLPSREERLVSALNDLMHGGTDIQAAALVSLDGFTMASALPAGMHADRVGAMSAAILGLGERAAAELGRGRLSQVFIQGDSGYVLLMAAGERAVLTVMTDSAAKIGLVLYDTKSTAERIGQILG